MDSGASHHPGPLFRISHRKLFSRPEFTTVKDSSECELSTNYGYRSVSLEAAGHEIDVLVNNAGYSIYGPMETLTEEEVRSMLETLYLGPVRLIRAVLPHMRKRKYGVIVNISSGAALEGRDSMGAYAGAKAALDGASCQTLSFNV